MADFLYHVQYTQVTKAIANRRHKHIKVGSVALDGGCNCGSNVK